MPSAGDDFAGGEIYFGGECSQSTRKILRGLLVAWIRRSPFFQGTFGLEEIMEAEGRLWRKVHQGRSTAVEERTEEEGSVITHLPCRWLIAISAARWSVKVAVHLCSHRQGLTR